MEDFDPRSPLRFIEIVDHERRYKWGKQGRDEGEGRHNYRRGRWRIVWGPKPSPCPVDPRTWGSTAWSPPRWSSVWKRTPRTGPYKPKSYCTRARSNRSSRCLPFPVLSDSTRYTGSCKTVKNREAQALLKFRELCFLSSFDPTITENSRARILDFCTCRSFDTFYRSMRRILRFWETRHPRCIAKGSEKIWNAIYLFALRVRIYIFTRVHFV